MKIFQKIRRQLLAESRFKNYLPYALGEILLVVIGILIALQVNNWNESRKRDLTEAEFIAGIKSDLQQDKEYIAGVVKRAEVKKEVFALLQKELYNYYKTNRPALDSLLAIFFEPQHTFYPVMGSFQSAISGNELGQFKNKRFSKAVTTLYNSTYARLTDNAKGTDDRWYYLVKKYSHVRRTGHLPDMDQTRLDEFLDDLSYHMYGLSYYQTLLDKTVLEIDGVLSQ